MIRILATGGTIAGASDADSGGQRYTAGVVPVERLLGSVEGLDASALEAEQVLSLDSKDMTPADWLTLRAACLRALEDPAVGGLVILHGTDTMEETAYFLHLVLPPGKPVILTGAMRPADHPQADGPANIRAALELAAGNVAPGGGVWVSMNGRRLSARHVHKARTTGLDAFAERLADGQGHKQGSSAAGCFADVFPESLPPVFILPGYAGAPADLIDACVAAGARGLVLALTGHGSIPATWDASLARAAARSVLILRASRCEGTVSRNANADDDGRGWLTAGDLPPAKARIALMLGLAAGWDQSRLAEMLPKL